MKKILFLALLLVLLLTTAVVSADPPEPVAPAVRIYPEDGTCESMAGSIDNPIYLYQGPVWIQYSNGAKGHSTYKCKMDLISGPPQYAYWQYPFVIGDTDCVWTISLEGQKGMFTAQCWGEWYP